MTQHSHNFVATDIHGNTVDLNRWDNHVILVVNVASKCGFTPQYKKLQQLYDKYKDQHFTILAFPCNQFANQEKGSNEQIKQFCESKYHITFPLFGKIDVNTDQAHPLFRYLKSKAPGIAGTETIKWNFTKFLISRDFQQIIRYAPSTSPLKLEKDIEEFLKAPYHPDITNNSKNNLHQEEQLTGDIYE